jgi:hypothetical protein
MPAPSPIQLGSAVSGWTFESGSSFKTSASGIQSVTIKALWPDGSTILDNLPGYGSSISGFTSYIPSSFLLDRIDTGASIDYVEGKVARASFTFKRQDPNVSTYRTVFVDTVVNYKSSAGLPTYQFGADGEPVANIFGFPEPVCTVKYSSVAQPTVSDGIHALPGSSRAVDFPPVPTIGVPINFTLPPGSVVTYFDGTSFTSVGPLTSQTTFTFSQNYIPNPSGWRLTKLNVTPVCSRSFFDVEEEWRIFYQFQGATLSGTVPPLP